MKNKAVITAMLAAVPLIAGCDYFKNKQQADSQSRELADWSCTAESNVQQIQDHLKSEYLKAIERKLRQDEEFEADQALLHQINNALKFELSRIVTRTDQVAQAKELECHAQLLVKFPKGLQQRASNAFQQKPCEECDYEHEQYTLQDYLQDYDSDLTLNNDQLKGGFNYSVVKTDQEGLQLNVPSQSAVISTVSSVVRFAVQFAAYQKYNQLMDQDSEKYQQQYSIQAELALKAMNLRKKDLDAEQAKVVERLNATWDRFNDEQKQQQQQDQTEWFERRDVDCKVLAQKSIQDTPENERETYQKHAQYWDEGMLETNLQMQYSKCFIQKTNERIVYLNNLFT